MFLVNYRCVHQRRKEQTRSGLTDHNTTNNECTNIFKTFLAFPSPLDDIRVVTQLQLLLFQYFIQTEPTAPWAFTERESGHRFDF